MVDVTPTVPTLGDGDGRLRASIFHARERRRSLAGVTDKYRTHRYPPPSNPIAVAASFPDRARPIMFHTAIEITGASPAGLVFEFGRTAAGCALWVSGSEIGFHAGPFGTALGANLVFDNGSTLPVGLEMDLVAAVVPGSGKIRLWGNGRDLGRAVATDGNGFAEWSPDNDGSFADAPAGSAVNDIDPGALSAPTDFAVVEALSIYNGSVPSHFNG